MVERAPDFRFIASNTFAIGLSTEQAIIKCALAEDPNNPQGAWEQVGIVTSLASAKNLMLALQLIIEAHEKSNGTILIDQSKIEDMRRALNPDPA
jgi:hypothetical protein